MKLKSVKIRNRRV